MRVLGVVALVVGCLLGCEGPPATPEEREAREQASQETRRELDAMVASKKAVRQFLKHPHDASFGWAPDVARNEEGDLLMIKSTVKAPNDFGAMLTHEWATIVSFRDGAAEVLECVIGDETVYRSPKIDELMAERDEQIKRAAEEQAEALAKHRVEKPEPEPEYRTWTDSSGKFQVEAEFASMTMGQVKLRKEDGEEITLPMERLSEADQAWIRDRF